MHWWKRRKRQSGLEAVPLTPTQVQMLRARDERMVLWITRVFIVGAVLWSISLAIITGAYDRHTLVSLVVLGVGNAIVFSLALIGTWAGRAREAAILVLLWSVLSIVAIASEVSASTSIESSLFGMALLPFLIINPHRSKTRVTLSFLSLSAYVLCEVLWPAGEGAHELPPALNDNLAMFNRVFAALLLGLAIMVLQMKVRLSRRILEGAARYGELRATTDELTGVLNRRPVIDALGEYAERGRANYGIALIDLDFFKEINDTHGHDCGDAIITLVARTLQEHFRDTDMVSRWGGDEFLVLMPGVRHADLTPVLERLRAHIAGLHQLCDGHVHRISVSIGAAMGVPGQTPDECIATADHALYQAKQDGRNRVVTVGAALPTSALGRPV